LISGRCPLFLLPFFENYSFVVLAWEIWFAFGFFLLFFFWFPVFSDILHLWTHPFFPPFFCRIPFCFTIVLFLFLVLYFYFAVMTFFFSHCLFGCSLSAMLLCELDDCCPYIFFILACKFYVMCVREELLPSFLISINTLHASFCFLFHFFMFAFSYFLGCWLMLSHLLTIDFGFFFYRFLVLLCYFGRCWFWFIAVSVVLQVLFHDLRSLSHSCRYVLPLLESWFGYWFFRLSGFFLFTNLC
jgi:hypothetical protein